MVSLYRLESEDLMDCGSHEDGSNRGICFKIMASFSAGFEMRALEMELKRFDAEIIVSCLKYSPNFCGLFCLVFIFVISTEPDCTIKMSVSAFFSSEFMTASKCFSGNFAFSDASFSGESILFLLSLHFP